MEDQLNYCSVYTLMMGDCDQKKAIGKQAFVVGVKDSDYYDIDLLVKKVPNIAIVTRYPETPNAKYTHNAKAALKHHMLQPALITWKD